MPLLILPMGLLGPLALPLRGQGLGQGLDLAAPFGLELRLESGAQVGLLRLPVGEAALELGLESRRRGLGLPGLLQGPGHARLPPGQHLPHRPIQEALEKPHQDQEVDDLQGKGGPVDGHGQQVLNGADIPGAGCGRG